MARTWMCALMLTVPVLALADDPGNPRPPVSAGSASAGGAHSILSLPDGRVLTWGKGTQGQLGHGDQRSRSAPTHVTTLADITMVAAGGAHSLARSSAGRVYAWGANGSGQLGDGSMATRRRPILVPLVENVVMVAAGRSHSLALTADGRVLAWGANGDGQLGLGASPAMTVPAHIAMLSDVVFIAAGDSHSLAITRAGQLYAWGRNAHGQLGDGSRITRFTPIRITLAPVAAVAAGRSHTIALLRSGDVYSWGRGTFGQLGTGSVHAVTSPRVIEGLTAIAIEAGAHFSAAIRPDRVLVAWGSNRRGQLGDGTTVNRLRPIEVPGLTAISTLSLGDAHALVVTSTGSVWAWGDAKFGRLGFAAAAGQTTPGSAITGIPAWGPPIGTIGVPIIDPPGGHFNSPQTVALTSNGSFVEVRYTLDGTEPTMQSTRFVQPFVVSTATTLRARTFAVLTGEASVEAIASFTFNYGQLPAPLVSPPGGTFAVAPVVTIAATPGAAIRYTLDGNDPTEASTAYSTPIQIAAAGAELRARAFHVDWTPSPVVTHSYLTDVTPPTITTVASPPLIDGWMTTPVTLTFVCADDSGLVTCPPPVILDQDGRDQLVRGLASDPAGNQSSASIVVSVDLRPPSIDFVDSPDGAITAESEIAITTRIVDVGSGVDQAICNGQSVAIVNEHAVCRAVLRPGVNSIAVQATDVVGHLASAGLTVTRIGAPAELNLSPAQRAMLVHEIATFSLRDNFGAPVVGAVWRASDERVLSLSADDPPRITAIAPGTATITATKDGLSAEAEVVVHSSVTLAPGTTRWTFRTRPGFEMDAPIFTNRVDADTPDLFAVESSTWGQATLHALTADGELLWRQESPGIPLMGDSFGGVIAGVLFDPEEGIDYRAYVRLGRSGGVMPWRYDSRGLLQRPAQAANGIIYATEYVDTGLRNSDNSKLWDKHVIVLDGRTGARVHSIRLQPTRVTYTSQNHGTSGCRSTSVEKPPDTIGPIVDADGRAYLLVHRLAIDKTDVCNEPKTIRAARTIDVGVDVLVLEPGSPAVAYSIYSEQCSSPLGGLVLCDAPVTVHELVPDGIGGVLAKWERAAKVTPPASVTMQTAISRIGDGTITEHPVPTHTWIYAVGQAGTAYLLGLGGYRAMDVTTWTPRWTASLGWFTPIAAHPDGGLAVHDELTGSFRTVSSDGLLDEASAMPLPLKRPQQIFGSWIGVAPDGLRSVAGEFPDATRWQLSGGNAQRNLRVASPGVGIFAKSHMVRAPLNFQHISIRITPTFQAFWKQQKATDFVNRDEFGNYFMTMGAGTADGDSSLLCMGALTKGINRANDVDVKPVNLEQLPVLQFDETRIINDLYTFFGNYKNDLEYACLPEKNPGKYNSNSFASGLLRRAGTPLPIFPTRGNTAPGWATPVPAIKFNP